MDESIEKNITQQNIKEEKSYVLIKYKEDKFGLSYYLTEKLIFTTNREEACKFSILKISDNSDGSIYDKDYVSIHTGNRILSIDENGDPLLYSDISYSSSSRTLFKIENIANKDNKISFDEEIEFKLNDRYRLIFDDQRLKVSEQVKSLYLEKYNDPIIERSRLTSTVKATSTFVTLFDSYKTVILITLLITLLILTFIISKP